MREGLEVTKPTRVLQDGVGSWGAKLGSTCTRHDSVLLASVQEGRL